MKPVDFLKNTDRIFAMVTIVISMVMFYLIGGMEEPYSPGALSASTYPRIILGCIIFVSLLLMFRPVRPSVPDDDNKSNRGIVVIVFMVIYIALLEKVGFFLLTPVVLLTIPLIAGLKRYRLILFSVVVVMLGLYGVFVEVLNIPLPQGILGD
jgi:putative tricarboxylic transport membrane protein